MLRFLRGRAATTTAIAKLIGAPQTNFGRRAARDAKKLLSRLEARGWLQAKGRWNKRWQLTAAGRDAIAAAFLDLPEQLAARIRSGKGGTIRGSPGTTV